MNALRHSNPTQVTILGYLSPGLIKLTVLDNGSGFDSKEMLDLDTLQANNHFGLSGMFERAELIGAEIRIESERANGHKRPDYLETEQGIAPIHLGASILIC